MSKRTEMRQLPGVGRLLVMGVISAVVFALLLVTAAVAEEKIMFVQNGNFPLAKVCLTLSAVVCGVLCTVGQEGRRFLRALIGETVLLAVVTVILLAANGDLFGITYILNIVCLAFGAFAGALLGSNGGKRRRKRK